MSSQRPRLRNGVDLQLQSAFQDGNWAVAARLAQQRARTFNDQYFDIVKICAESQLDDPVAKFAAVVATEQYVKNGTVVKDVDALDLLEWATLGLVPGSAFDEMLGPLRVRAVKAAPKDKLAATRCLQSCLLHWDLVSAQQIAAILDRTFHQEREFMFWNIVITHLLAVRSQTSPNQKKLYGMLALKQIERAAQVTEQARVSPSDEETPARGIKTEEEILLLYEIVQHHATPGDLAKLISSPVFSPLSQFRMGRKELFQRVVAGYVQRKEWELLFDLCHDCLSDSDEAGEYTFLACDWSVWKQFIDAAAHLRSSNTEIVPKVQHLLLRLKRSKGLKPIYRRNILLARVLASFSLITNDQDDVQDGRPCSLRLHELLHYIDDQKSSAACFDDIREFLEQLDGPGLNYVVHEYSVNLAKAAKDAVASARINLLSMKMQFFEATCPISGEAAAVDAPGPKGVVSDGSLASESPRLRLRQIASAATEAYLSASRDLADKTVIKDEVLPELAMVVAFCNVELAFAGPRGYVPPPPSPQYLLRALLVLEQQASLTPKHSQLSILLVRLHLLLGSAHKSRCLWRDLAVKRTIVDSLAPIFFDRLSTVSPVVLGSSEKKGRELADTLRSHYATSLNLRMPRKLIDAFEAGAYGSIIDMPRYIEHLRSGCTRAMSLVEAARADRLLGEPCGKLLNDGHFDDVHDGVVLKNVVDHGSFPWWGCNASTPLHERLSLGPALSSARCHLGLLAEAFQDILSHKAPNVYKAGAAAMTIDHTFVVELMSQIGNSLSKFLHRASAHCTASEVLYYESVHLLATSIPLCANMDRTKPLPDVLQAIFDAVKMSISTQLGHLPKQDGTIAQAMAGLQSLHRITMLHDTGMAAKLATSWVLASNDCARERDRSGGSSLPKEVVSQAKALQTCAEAALRDGKAAMARLESEVGAVADFSTRLRAWALEGAGGEELLTGMVEDATVSGLVESWRQNMAGWSKVQWGAA